MSFNIEQNGKKRVVIVGGGFGGLKLANKLRGSGLQVVLIDKNNYHQFPPLIYQIASAGIEPSAIAFPFRKMFKHRRDFYYRMAEARAVFPEQKILQTSIGKVKYDYLVFAAGTTTNFYGNKHIEEEAIPMKTLSEAMGLRNALLGNLERSVTCATEQERQELLNIVIVGGGATGIEIAGAIAEMRRYVLPHGYNSFAFPQVILPSVRQLAVVLVERLTVVCFEAFFGLFRFSEIPVYHGFFEQNQISVQRVERRVIAAARKYRPPVGERVENRQNLVKYVVKYLIRCGLRAVRDVEAFFLAAVDKAEPRTDCAFVFLVILFRGQ